MLKHSLVEIPATNVRSLAWDGDDLVDWAGGATRYQLNGKSAAGRINYAYEFDAVATSPSGDYQVIYTRLGTKGLVLKRGELVREINRSYYFANAYEYPVALFSLKDGREVLAHCPDEYCRLEIDDLASGKRLTASGGRSPADFFHSRLAASPTGQHLLSAGWIWHPMDVVHVYDVVTALMDPSHLDGSGLPLRAWADESSAIFLDDRRLLVALEGIELDEDSAAKSSAPRDLRIFDLESGATLATTHPIGKIGSMMAVGEHHLLTFHEHPKLIHIASNEVVYSWPEIRSGTQVSSILMDSNSVPAMALDPANRRCAIAGNGQIHVLLFGG